jgi:preprotein translocase subunit SecE
MNRQVKRQMAKQGTDKPRAAQSAGGARRPPVNPQTERTGPRTYLREVQAEMKRVAWPPREEIFNSTVIVVIGVVVMTAVIFLFDWLAGGAVNHIF